MEPILITLDRTDFVALVSGRKVTVPVGENRIEIALNLDDSRLDPPQAREFLPAKRPAR